MICFTCHSYAWEDNTWTLGIKQDDVFDEVENMTTFVWGVNNQNNNVRFAISCYPSFAEALNLPTPYGPLLALLVADFDVWFGHGSEFGSSLYFEGRYQIDNNPTQTIIAGRNKLFEPESLQNLDNIIKYSTKIDANSNLLDNLMSGKKFVLKPWEKAEIRTSIREMGFGPVTNKVIDINKLLGDEGVAPLKDQVLRFSLNQSQGNIKKVMDFCEPHIKRWEEKHFNVFGIRP